MLSQVTRRSNSSIPRRLLKDCNRDQDRVPYGAVNTRDQQENKIVSAEGFTTTHLALPLDSCLRAQHCSSKSQSRRCTSGQRHDNLD
jgi:hypothetical protein